MSEMDTKAGSSWKYDNTLAVDLAARLAARTERAFTVRVFARFGEGTIAERVKVGRASPSDARASEDAA